jgi:hypothetical protein
MAAGAGSLELPAQPKGEFEPSCLSQRRLINIVTSCNATENMHRHLDLLLTNFMVLLTKQT